MRNLLKNRRLFNPYLWMGALLLLTAAFVDQTKPLPVALLMYIGLAVLVSIAVVLWKTKKLTQRNLLILMIAAGVLLRIGYVLYTPYTMRQHDVETFQSGQGHAGYILYIAQHFALPDTNKPWEFYHPPLHPVLAAIWLSLNLKLGAAAETAYENIQLLTCFYSCAALIVSLKIFREVLPRQAICWAIAILCFHPTFILLAGSLNNDMLMILFILAVIEYAFRWYHDPSLKNMALASLFLGLGMMTKISAALLIPVLAFLFLSKWRQSRGQPQTGFRPIKQGLVFCGISLPLGLWYAVRNFLLFGQPLFYVPKISNTYQYIGNFGVADRLWKIPWRQLLTPYQEWISGYNIPLSLLKTATFGEADFQLWPFANLLFFSNLVVVLFSIAAMIRVLFTRKRESNTVLLQSLGLFWLLLMGSYVKFCFSYPDICTQDFRYIVPTILTGSIFLGVWLSRPRKTSLASRLLPVSAKAAVVVFCIFSSVVYILLGVSPFTELLMK